MGRSYFNRSGPEVDDFYSENGLKVTFVTTAEPQTPKPSSDLNGKDEFELEG